MENKESGSGELTLAQVKRVAGLARLTVSDAEAPRLARDMSNILQYVQKLNELDTSQVTPTAHAVASATVLREDVVKPGLPVDIGLRGAPERLGDGFGVPKIIE